jgi:hypothetical protein
MFTYRSYGFVKVTDIYLSDLVTPSAITPKHYIVNSKVVWNICAAQKPDELDFPFLMGSK